MIVAHTCASRYLLDRSPSRTNTAVEEHIRTPRQHFWTHILLALTCCICHGICLVCLHDLGQVFRWKCNGSASLWMTCEPVRTYRPLVEQHPNRQEGWTPECCTRSATDSKRICSCVRPWSPTQRTKEQLLYHHPLALKSRGSGFTILRSPRLWFFSSRGLHSFGESHIGAAVPQDLYIIAKKHINTGAKHMLAESTSSSPKGLSNETDNGIPEVSLPVVKEHVVHALKNIIPVSILRKSQCPNDQQHIRIVEWWWFEDWCRSAVNFVAEDTVGLATPFCKVFSRSFFMIELKSTMVIDAISCTICSCRSVTRCAMGLTQ